MTIKEAKKISIPSILDTLDLTSAKKGSKIFYSSPFSSDSDPSLLWNEHNNTFYDYSTGLWGDSIQLIQHLEECNFKEALRRLELFKESNKVIEFDDSIKSVKRTKNTFKLDSYINNNPEEVNAIKEYARGRGIYRGYYPCFFYEYKKEVYNRVPAMGYLHYDYDLKVCGLKMRRIDDESPRFSARGKMGLHIITLPFFEKAYKHNLYIVESESSANSLAEYLNYLKVSAVVISCGSNTTAPTHIPKEILNKLQIDESEIKVILDYDGDEEKYNKVLKLYEHLGAKNIRILLDKGEDINSLFDKGKVHLIENLI